MIADSPTGMVVLQLSEALLAQLWPFAAGLDLAATVQRAGAASPTQQLTMPGAVYDALVERVGTALDYDVRWQPNEDEPDGFVERVQPLHLTDGTAESVDCAACGARVLANRSEVQCMCGQALCLR